MFKSSILYRRLWYVKKRNIKSLHIYSRLISVIIIFVFLIIYVRKQTFPYMAQISELKVKEMFTVIVNDSIKSATYDSLNYDKLVIVNKDKDGSITSLQINSLEAARISSEISLFIQNRLSALSIKTLDLPLGVMSGKKFLSGFGPDIHIRYKPTEVVRAYIESELSNTGLNQTRHVIHLRIQTEIAIFLPLKEKKIAINTDIPLAETIIVGTIADGFNAQK